MGNKASSASSRPAPAASPSQGESTKKVFQIRVTEGGKENPKHLHYVTPGGDAVWVDAPVDYLKDIDSFETAQRICREIMISNKYEPGTRVQFFQNRHRIKHSTVLKPHA